MPISSAELGLPVSHSGISIPLTLCNVVTATVVLFESVPPNKLEQIKAAQSCANLSRSGVRIQPKCWILNSFPAWPLPVHWHACLSPSQIACHLPTYPLLHASVTQPGLTYQCADSMRHMLVSFYSQWPYSIFMTHLGWLGSGPHIARIGCIATVWYSFAAYIIQSLT